MFSKHPEPRGYTPKDYTFDIAEIAACAGSFQFVVLILFASMSILIKIISTDCLMARQRLFASYYNTIFIRVEANECFIVVEILTIFIQGIIVFEALDGRLLKSQFYLGYIHFLLLPQFIDLLFGGVVLKLLKS